MSKIVLRVALAEDEEEFIRRARAETLAAIGGAIHPELICPIPHAIYLFAYDTDRRAPVGLAESAFLAHHYPCYSDVPWGGVADLTKLYPFEQLAGVRTVYVTPEFRLRQALYLKLILGSAYIFRRVGARYATANTSILNTGLARLYTRTGGTYHGKIQLDIFGSTPLAVYGFDLDRLLQHAALARTLRDMDVDFNIVTTVCHRGQSMAARAGR